MTSLAGKFNIVLGVELAEALQVAVGDKVTVTLAEGMVTPAGVMPRTKRFTVSGIYRVGMYEFDRRLAFINMGDAQRLYRHAGRGYGRASGGHRNLCGAGDRARSCAREHGEHVLVSDWTRRHVNFFRSIQITKSILFVILLMVDCRCGIQYRVDAGDGREGQAERTSRFCGRLARGRRAS